jgi:hypothetical protein
VLAPVLAAALALLLFSRFLFARLQQAVGTCQRTDRRDPEWAATAGLRALAMTKKRVQWARRATRVAVVSALAGATDNAVLISLQFPAVAVLSLSASTRPRTRNMLRLAGFFDLQQIAALKYRKIRTCTAGKDGAPIGVFRQGRLGEIGVLVFVLAIDCRLVLAPLQHSHIRIPAPYKGSRCAQHSSTCAL